MQMFELELPWWELMTRAALTYGALLVLVRISGKRTVGQFTPFDLLIVMLLSEGVSNGLLGGDLSLVGGLLVAATLIALNLLAAFATSRSERVERLLDGEPVIIGRDGCPIDHVLRRHRLSRGDFDKALRQADCDLAQLKLAILEHDGRISVLRQRTGE